MSSVERSREATPLPPSLFGRDDAGGLPRVFGRYVLFDRIGRGGMADIFLARADLSLGGSRLCVLKQILPELGHDPQFERLLIEEAKLAARLTHGNVVQVFDLGRADDRLFIAMEYVEGFDLHQLLRAVTRAKLGLPAEFALLIVRDTLRALDYAHRLKDSEGRPLGLVHRDVSPSNVLISFEGEVKLCDFGIARAFSGRELLGAPEQIPAQARIEGKSAYMAPEHARGQAIDARADVFAAGIILWELCAGRRLYRGSEPEMLKLAQQGAVPPLPERGLPRHAKLQAVLSRALAAAREERFENGQEFLAALEDYAIETKLMASQLRFGAFLSEHFGQEMIELRRQRELSARALPSELPALGAPTLVGSSVLLQAEGHPRQWREPGASEVLSLTSSSGSLSVESSSTTVVSPSMPEDVSERDLERSLMGLEVLAQESIAEAHARVAGSERPPRLRLPLPVSDPPPLAAPASRDWLWYASALALLLLGVLGYFWT